MCTVKKARIAYTGPAVEDGTMPVKELAPALLSFAELVENSYHVIGGKQKVQVLLNQDSLNKGSFDITFLLNLDLLEQVKLFVSNARDSGLDDLMTVLGWIDSTAGVTTLVAGGVFGLIHKIHGRKIKKIQRHENRTADITLDDNEKLTTDENTLKVFLDVKCRINIEKIIEPLSEDGVDGFQLRNPKDIQDKVPVVNISKAEANLFKAPPAADEDDMENITAKQNIIARIVSVNFDDGKWRLSDGTNTFWATIADEEFLKKVDSGEVSFSKGDNLQIEYYMEQKIKNGKLSTDYIVTKVLQLLKAPRQIKLDFEETDTKDSPS